MEHSIAQPAHATGVRPGLSSIPIEMQTSSPSVRVNGVEITRASILVEAQNHPASTPQAALGSATEALVIRELLLQASRSARVVPQPETDQQGRRETDEDALIREIIEQTVKVPAADEHVCRRYYDNHREIYRSPDLYEAAHILFAADPRDEHAYGAAVTSAGRAIEAIKADPGCFSAMAREYSACTSSTNDGRLGQIARGDTVPEFDRVLAELEEGQLHVTPVRSRFGAHVLRLDRKLEGRMLPFEVVRERIAAYLHEASWRRAVSQYIQLLVGQASIEGCSLRGASSPLVQ